MARFVAGAVLSLGALMLIGGLGASRAQPAGVQAGSFAPGVDIGLDPEQTAQAARALTVADRLKAGPLPVMAMVVSALGESMFRPVPNGGGSGYCGVFQAHPDNIPCHDTEQQAESFLKGGKGFQAGGAIALARRSPQMTPGAIATAVEASGQPAAFYDRHRAQAERIITAWRAGGLESTPLEDASAQQVLANRRIHLTPGQRADVAAGGIDPRLLSSLNWLAARHVIQICALRRDHSPGSNHEKGRAADICAVDLEICRGGPEGHCADAVHELADVRGVNRSTELIYCWDPDPRDPDMFARADHCDHLHLGWD